jgi:dTDP-4-dehydrorhamnose reductase
MHILLTGASGLLGSYLLRLLSGTAHRVTALSGSQSGERFGISLLPVPLTDSEAVRQTLSSEWPEAIIHAAAMASVAKCFRSPDLAWRVNVDATCELVRLASERSVRFILVSTDLVFDGRQGCYNEGDEPRPLTIYGRTKLAAEQATLDYHRAAVVRLSLLFGPSLGQRRSFFEEQVTALKERRPCRLFSDEWRTPLALSTAASALTKIVESDFTGLLHLGGPERMSRLEMGQRLARVLHIDQPSIEAVARDSAATDEPRPRDTSLDSSRWRTLFPDQPWQLYEDALRDMFSASVEKGSGDGRWNG